MLALISLYCVQRAALARTLHKKSNNVSFETTPFANKGPHAQFSRQKNCTSAIVANNRFQKLIQL
jgi:hypothetical protein